MKLEGYIYVTDVCRRFEEDDIDDYGCWRRWHENLRKKIPVYSMEEEDG